MNTNNLYQKIYTIVVYHHNKEQPIYNSYDNFKSYQEAEDFGKAKVKENGNGAYYIKWHFVKIKPQKRKIKLERKKAEWLEHPRAEETPAGFLISNYECTNCHTWKTDYSNYCPECGYKMKGVIYKNENNNN